MTLLQGAHSVLSPASFQAASIARLATIFFVLAAVIWLLVLGFLFYSLARSRGLGERQRDAALTRRQIRSVGVAITASTLLLLLLGVVDFRTGHRIATAMPARISPDTVQITLVGHQWWWEIRYDPPVLQDRFTTANEMHIPVGRPVQIKLQSSDVIHSFWAPSLHGKTDLIPSYTGSIVIQADTPGVFRAQCAEYCGRQHAKMALFVIAESEAQYAAWYANELKASPAPRDAGTTRGQEVYLGAACPLCHTIRGTPSQGKVAPELTHLATRRTIAAGTLPNRREPLAGWVVNSQGIKPGNFMPPIPVPARDLTAPLDYLASLR